MSSNPYLNKLTALRPCFKTRKFHPSQVEREYLTIDELLTVMKTPCPSNEEVKKAFIFACFAGLRLSDIRELTWAKIKTSPDGAGKTTQIYADVVMAKLQKAVNSTDGIF